MINIWSDEVTIAEILLFSLLRRIAGNIASAIKTPNPSLGASGAVFGLMGGEWI